MFLANQAAIEQADTTLSGQTIHWTRHRWLGWYLQFRGRPAIGMGLIEAVLRLSIPVSDGTASVSAGKIGLGTTS